MYVCMYIYIYIKTYIYIYQEAKFLFESIVGEIVVEPPLRAHPKAPLGGLRAAAEPPPEIDKYKYTYKYNDNSDTTNTNNNDTTTTTTTTTNNNKIRNRRGGDRTHAPRGVSASTAVDKHARRALPGRRPFGAQYRCIHACMHTHTHTFLHTERLAQTLRRLEGGACIHTCIHAGMHAYTHACLHHSTQLRPKEPAILRANSVGALAREPRAHEKGARVAGWLGIEIVQG